MDKRNERSKIIIDDHFYIAVDPRNYTLVEIISTNEDGESNVKFHGHFTEIDQALIKLAKINALSAHEEVSIGKYLRELKNEYMRLSRIVKGEMEDE